MAISGDLRTPRAGVPSPERYRDVPRIYLAMSGAMTIGSSARYLTEYTSMNKNNCQALTVLDISMLYLLL